MATRKGIRVNPYSPGLGPVGPAGPAGAPGATAPHAASHQNGGADEISVAGLSGLLADGQTPLAHTHAEADVTGLVADLAATEKLANKNVASGYAGLSAGSKLTGTQQVYGSAANTAAEGNDARLSDSRTPTAHAPSHKSGGSDPIKLDELAAPTDVTTLNASTTEHGLLKKLSNVATEFLNGQGAWATPAGAGNVTGPASATDNALARFDATTGKLIQDSLAILDDTGNLAIPGLLNLSGAAAGQIKFPATQNASSDANTQDDFERGGWTPVIGGATSESGQTYSAQLGRYQKIGSWVYVSCYVELSAKGTITGNIAIKGLPFTAKNTANQLLATPLYWGALATTWVYVTGLVVNNTTQTLVRGASVAAVGSETSLATADIGNGTKFVFFFGYETTG